ncbi:MAG TPA: hypothetical protein VIL85_03710 [Thermomicrobiales bacterium]|jgi:PBP1b-binding outer membrane lipoprotein LpoB
MILPGITKIGAGMLSMTLLLGGGTAVATAHSATAATTNPNRQANCQDYQTKLAQNLNITAQQLHDTRKKTANQVIDDRLAAGQITPAQAQAAHDRVNNSTGACTAVGQGGAGAVRQAAQHLRKVELQAAAQKLGLSEHDLLKELRGGLSLAQVAQAHNVSRDDLKATMRVALQTTLDQAVHAGKLTQSQEDKALAAFDTRADKLLDRVWQANK